MPSPGGIRRRRLIVGAAGAAAATAAGAPLLVQRLRDADAGKAATRPRVAYLGADDALAQAFRARLDELGWRDGRTLQLVVSNTSALDLARADVPAYNGTDPATDNFLLDVTLHRPVRAIVATGDALTKRTQAATQSIPVVMTASADPVALGFAQSLAHPGGNITGLSAIVPELDAKRLELVRDLLPGARRVAVFWNAVDPVRGGGVDALQSTAERFGLELVPVKIDFSATRFSAAMPLGMLDAAAAVAPIGALVVLLDGQAAQSIAPEIIAGAQQRRLPTLFTFAEAVEQGGLLSYGPNLPALWQRAAEYVVRLLHGAHAAALPIEEASSFDLVVNTSAAKELGVTVPPALLARATRVLAPPAATAPANATSGAHTLTLPIAREPEHLDPARGAAFAVEISVLRLLWTGLFVPGPAGEVLPGLAAEVPAKENGGISPDGTTFTVRLKPDQRFSDGSPLSAHDVEYAVKRFLDPAVGAAAAAWLLDIAGASAYHSAFGSKEQPKTPTEAELARLRDALGVKAVDDHTIVFTREPGRRGLAGSFLVRLESAGAFPVRQAEAEQLGERINAGLLTGNGPFVIEEHVVNDHLTLAPNANYTAGPPPRLQRLTLRVAGDTARRLDLFKASTLDATPLIQAQFAALAADPAYRDRVKYEPNQSTVWISFNTARSPFDDVRVRLALASAIDRRALVDRVLQGFATPSATLLPPRLPGYDPDNEAIARFDPDAARALLAQAGFPDGRGFPAGGTLINLGNSFVDFVLQGWRDVLNVSLTSEPLPAPADYQRRLASGAWQTAVSSWSADYPHADDFMRVGFASDGQANLGHYSNAAFDAAVERAGTETDPRTQAALWSTAERLLLGDCPGAVLAHGAIASVFNPRVAGIQGHTADIFLFGDGALEGIDTTA